MKRRICGTVAVAACLAVPTEAMAHGSVYEIVAKVVPPGNAAPKENELVDQKRYVVANHGHAFVLRETNGRTGNGMVNYTQLPGAFRTTQLPDKQQWLDPKYVSGAQPHATCDTPALTDKANILSWQQDPFYDYIPFQATSAGLDDDPASWIGVVKNLTGVDLATTTDLAAACAGIGGTYVQPDETQSSQASFVGDYVASVVEPIQARLTEVESQVAAAATEIANLTAANRVLTLTAPASVKRGRFIRRGITVTLDGPPSRRVRVTLRHARLGLLGRATGTTGADYDLGITLKASKRAARKLRKVKTKRIRATLEATSGDRFARKTIKLRK